MTCRGIKIMVGEGCAVEMQLAEDGRLTELTVGAASSAVAQKLDAHLDTLLARLEERQRANRRLRF